MECLNISNKSSIIFNGVEIDGETIHDNTIRAASVLEINNHNRNSPIVIAIERTPDLIIAMLAAIEYGCPFVPIDLTMPMERIGYMISDCAANTVITSKEYVDNFKFMNVILIEQLHQVNSRKTKLNDNILNDIMYILYTSGTTGSPKGIEVTRTGFINFMNGVSNVIDFHEGKRIACLTTVSFDIFFMESIMALYKGLTVVLANRDEQHNPKLMAKMIANMNINMIQMTPSRMKLLLCYDKTLLSLNEVTEIMIGGEHFPIDLLSTLQKNTTARIYNMYGPTETTIWSSISDLTNKQSVDIGKPIKGTQIYILDENLNVTKCGEVGEICISGKGVARGYINNTEKTKINFVQSAQFPDTIIYKTGDLGRYLCDGNLECLGRIDNQVKIRGYRVELEEIDAVLSGFDKISQSIVTAMDYMQEQILVAFYCADSELLNDDIRSFLKQKLPNYMIPGLYIRIDELPLMINGKVNRRQLISDYRKIVDQDINIINDMDVFTVQEKVLQIVLKQLGNNQLYKTTDMTKFSLPDIDSITFINIVVNLETVFGFEFDDEKLINTAFSDINELCDYVKMNMFKQDSHV